MTYSQKQIFHNTVLNMTRLESKKIIHFSRVEKSPNSTQISLETFVKSFKLTRFKIKSHEISVMSDNI